MNQNTSSSQETQSALALRRAVSDSCLGLVERETLVEMIALAAIAGEHVLVIGAPGTAKSEAVRRISKAVGGNYFEYLLGRFTEPSEIFGPVDLRKLREGIVETEISGMLPEAEIAFLDEVFQGSTAILNTLLGILNERTFLRGHTRIRCPLRVCVGASNALPEEDSLAAFADRFLVRIFVEPTADSLLENLLASGWQLQQRETSVLASISDLDVLNKAALRADLSGVRATLAYAVRLLRNAGIRLSDRRVIKAQKLIAAAAVLAGKANPDEADLWPLIFAVPTRDQQSLARETLRDLLDRTENLTLPTAAEEASLGPQARAVRIAAAGLRALEEQPANNNPKEQQAWQFRLEAIAREIDAGFAAEQMPPKLRDIREKIVAIIKRNSTGSGSDLVTS